MLAYTFYETDGRVMRYAEALTNAGAEVEAIVLRRQGQEALAVLNRVKVFRIQERTKNESGKFSYLFRIAAFFFRSLVFITRRHFAVRYQLIHVHSVPDFEVFAAIIPKLLGAKIILDIHDIVPEFYAAKFKVGEQTLVFEALKIIEKLSALFADHVIIANALWQKKITARSVRESKCSAYINYPDLAIFYPGLKGKRQDQKFILIYPGTLNWHQGLDIAINAVAFLQDKIPGIELHIYGEGSAVPELNQQIIDLNLSDKVILRPPMPLRDIAKVMANADVGVVPKRNDGFGGDAFSTKIMEFMAVGVPVIVSDTRVDKHYFNDSLVRFFKAEDTEALAGAIWDAYSNPDKNTLLTQASLAFVRQNSWNVKGKDYLSLVNKLVGVGAG